MQPISFIYFYITFLDDVSGIMFPSSVLSLYTYVMSHNCNASDFSLFCAIKLLKRN
jgi:hypothetical protein